LTDTSRGERAADRAAELRDLLTKLRAGAPVSADDLALAKQRERDAHDRARSAHISAAEAHEHAAEAHDWAAAMDPDQAARHLDAAAADRAARDEDYRAADLETGQREPELKLVKGRFDSGSGMRITRSGVLPSG
jgi:hypothetical protein